MNNRTKRDILFLLLGIIITASVTVGATLLYKAQDVEFQPVDNEWNVDNVKDALDELYKDNSVDIEETPIIWEIPYNGTTGLNGSVQEFKAPVTGIYKLETWGAQAGSINTTKLGGYGGYSTGAIKLNANEIIYIAVGGSGTKTNTNPSNIVAGGYNGGGEGSNNSSGSNRVGSSGGGATHIASVSGELYELEDKKGVLSSSGKYYISNDIFIVAGGGGGTWYLQNNTDYFNYDVGHGGGFIGTTGIGKDTPSGEFIAYGGKQTSAGDQHVNPNTVTTTTSITATFGKGANSSLGLGGGGGGGGGFFGGNSHRFAGGGGSGYIASSRLISYKSSTKAMYCYKCEESSESELKTFNTNGNTVGVDKTNCPNGYSYDPVSKCAKAGHGHARISLISIN